MGELLRLLNRDREAADDVYQDRVAVIRDYVESKLPNLHLVGRRNTLL